MWKSSVSAVLRYLGCGVAHGPAAEADDPPAAVFDRKHHPGAEAVVGLAALILRANHQARRHQHVVGKAGPMQRRAEARTLRGKAQAEAGDQRVIEAAPAQVGQGVAAFGRSETGLEVRRRRLVGGVENVAAILPRPVARLLHRHGQAAPAASDATASRKDMRSCCMTKSMAVPWAPQPKQW